MSATVTLPSTRLLSDIAARIRSQHRGVLSELSLEAVEDGVIIKGRAKTFYGKQVALHETQRQCQCPVIANLVIVK